MATRYYFLLSSLPALPALGEAPPLSLEAFRELAAQTPGLTGARSRIVGLRSVDVFGSNTGEQISEPLASPMNHT